jgi:hypothetical protein
MYLPSIREREFRSQKTKAGVRSQETKTEVRIQNSGVRRKKNKGLFKMVSLESLTP